METAFSPPTERRVCAAFPAFSRAGAGGKVCRMTREHSTALLRDARQGNPSALDELYRRFGVRVLAFIRVRLGPALRARVDSQDILQATLMKSFDRLGQFEGADGATLMGWLARIAENEIRDQAAFQHRQRRDAAADVPLDEAASAASDPARSVLSDVIANEEAARLTEALERLEPDHRTVIVLRKFEERSFREVAERMGRSEDACRMLLARAMARLTLVLGAASCPPPSSKNAWSVSWPGTSRTEPASTQRSCVPTGPTCWRLSRI
jgi:RNA polymerase sigma-70 factor, ECF subfamily